MEREHLDRVLPLAAGYHHVRLNSDGVLGMLTGVGTAKAASSVMALGTDLVSIFRRHIGLWRELAEATRQMYPSARRFGLTT